MNTTSQQTMTTIPAAEPAPAQGAAATPSSPVTEAPVAVVAAAPAVPSHNVDVARRLERVAAKEAKFRRREVDLQAKEAEVTARMAEAAKKLAESEEALSDPVDFYLKAGKDPIAVAKKFGTPETALEKEVRLLKEKDAKRDAEAEATKKANETAQQTAARHAALRDFVSAITPTECPNLTALYEAPEVPALIDALLNSPSAAPGFERMTVLQAYRAQTGKNPTDKEIREILEYKASVRASSLRKQDAARAALASATQTPAPPQATESGPRGISNQHAGSGSPSLRHGTSLEEHRRKAKADLVAALEAEASTRSGE